MSFPRRLRAATAASLPGRSLSSRPSTALSTKSTMSSKVNSGMKSLASKAWRQATNTATSAFSLTSRSKDSGLPACFDTVINYAEFASLVYHLTATKEILPACEEVYMQYYLTTHLSLHSPVCGDAAVRELSRRNGDAFLPVFAWCKLFTAIPAQLVSGRMPWADRLSVKLQWVEINVGWYVSYGALQSCIDQGQGKKLSAGNAERLRLVEEHIQRVHAAEMVGRQFES